MKSGIPWRRILLAAILGASPLVAYAQASAEFPARPIRLIVPVSAGGGLDTTTRAIAQKLTQAWGQQVIVDNRPGASGVIAFDIAIKAAPDGHTLLMMSADHVINSVPSAKRPYDVTVDLSSLRVSNFTTVTSGVSFRVASTLTTIMSATRTPRPTNPIILVFRLNAIYFYLPSLRL